MRRRRSLAQFVAVLLVAPLLALVPQTPAQADDAPATPQVAWKRDIRPDISPNAGMLSGLDGSVTAGSCATDPDNILTVDYGNLSIAKVSSGGGAVYPCTNANTWAVGADGTIYTQSLLPGADSRPKIAAYRNGQTIWPNGGYINTPANCDTRYVWLTALRLGTDGYLYAGSWDQLGCSSNEFHLTKIDPANGNVVFQKHLDGAQPAELIMHQGGLAVFYPNSRELRFFDYSGTDLSSYTVGNPVTLPPQHASMNGQTFFGITTGQPHSDCWDSNITDAVVGYGPQGQLWQPYALPACSTLMSVRPTPSGGVVVLTRTKTNSGTDENHLIALHGDGTLLWEKVLAAQEANGDGQRTFHLGRATALVDTHGTVVLWRHYWFNSREFAQLTVRKGDTGNVTWAYHSESVDPSQDVKINDPQNIAMSHGRLYVGMRTPASQVELYALSVPNLGPDYPRGAITAASVSSVPQRKYVALGDSFSSGEGVPPFDPATNVESGSSQNRCHRSYYAYAELLDWDPSANLQLLDFVACSGATTGTMFGGQYTEGPQFNALMSDTQVVTLTIGGNDIGFANVASLCVVELCEFAIDNARDHLTPTDLGVKLMLAYEEIKERAPDAEVYVLGYPALVPPKDQIEGSCEWGVQMGQISEAQIEDLRDLEEDLNTFIQAEAEEAGFRFIPNNAFDGHELCTDDSYVVRARLWPDQEYSLHPTLTGQDVLRRLVRQALNN